MATFTPQTENWRFFSNSNAEPVGGDALEAENTAPTVAAGDVMRLRWQIHETGNANGLNQTFSFEYLYNSTWYAMSGGSAHFLPYDGLGTEGSVVTTLLLTSSTEKGEYCESNTNVDSVGKNDYHEFDLCFASIPGNVVAGYNYEFRIKLDGTVVPVGGGSSAANVDMAAASVQVPITQATFASSAETITIKSGATRSMSALETASAAETITIKSGTTRAMNALATASAAQILTVGHGIAMSALATAAAAETILVGALIFWSSFDQAGFSDWTSEVDPNNDLNANVATQRLHSTGCMEHVSDDAVQEYVTKTGLSADGIYVSFWFWTPEPGTTWPLSELLRPFHDVTSGLTSDIQLTRSGSYAQIYGRWGTAVMTYANCFTEEGWHHIEMFARNGDVNGLRVWVDNVLIGTEDTSAQSENPLTDFWFGGTWTDGFSETFYYDAFELWQNVDNPGATPMRPLFYGDFIPTASLAAAAAAEAITLKIDAGIGLDTLAAASAAEDITSEVGAIISVDALSAAAVAQTINVAAGSVVAVDALSFAGAAETITVASGAAIDMGTLSTAAAVENITIGMAIAVPMFAASIAAEIKPLPTILDNLLGVWLMLEPTGAERKDSSGNQFHMPDAGNDDYRFSSVSDLGGSLLGVYTEANCLQEVDANCPSTFPGKDSGTGTDYTVYIRCRVPASPGASYHAATIKGTDGTYSWKIVNQTSSTIMRAQHYGDSAHHGMNFTGVNDGNWHSYVIRWQGSTDDEFSFWKDGVKNATTFTVSNVRATTTPFKIGNFEIDGVWPFEDYIDEVAVYDRALPDQYIGLIASTGLHPYFATSADALVVATTAEALTVHRPSVEPEFHSSFEVASFGDWDSESDVGDDLTQSTDKQLHSAQSAKLVVNDSGAHRVSKSVLAGKEHYISFWMWTDDPTTWDDLIVTRALQDGSADFSCWIDFRRNGVNIEVGGIYGDYAIPWTIAWSTAGWHHVEFYGTGGSNKFQLFIDGTIKRIGSPSAQSGQLDEIRFGQITGGNINDTVYYECFEVWRDVGDPGLVPMRPLYYGDFLFPNALDIATTAEILTIAMGINISPDEADATAAAETITISSGAAIDLDALSAAGVAETISIEALEGGVGISVDALATASTAETLTIGHGIAITAASSAFVAETIVVSAGVDISPDALASAFIAETITLQAGAVIPLDTLSAAAASETLTLEVGAVLAVDTLSAAFVAEQIQVSVGGEIPFDALAAPAVANTITLQVGAVIAHDALAAAASAEDLTLEVGSVIGVDALASAAVAETITFEIGAVIALDTLAAAAVADTIQIAAEGEISLDPLSVAVVAQPITLAPVVYPDALTAQAGAETIGIAIPMP
jgi:hypothetical protein